MLYALDKVALKVKQIYFIRCKMSVVYILSSLMPHLPDCNLFIMVKF